MDKPIPSFITFEGIEGAGKSTQARLLMRRLRKEGYRVILVRDPGTTKIGEKIRRILKHDRPSEIAELFLFLAVRRQLVDEIVKPYLQKGYIVISDRWTESTLAYQGAGRMLMPETLPMLCYIASGGIEPNTTFILDISPEEGLQRKSGRDRIENEDIEFFRRVREFYLSLPMKDEKYVLIDATLSPLEIHEIVLRRLGLE